MKSIVLTTRKDVIKAVIDALPGGRAAATSLLGLQKTKQFDNYAYSDKHRPLSDLQVRDLELCAGTNFLPDYVASLYGGMFVKLANPDHLDNVELYAMSVNVSTRRGAVDQAISNALADGSISREEANEILTRHNQHLAARHSEVLSAIALYSAHKQPLVMA